MANPIDEAKELQQMLVSYAKQETIDPLRSLGGYLAFGLAGAVFMFIGITFLALSALRFTQSSFDTFDGGSWGSLAPYGIALAVLFVMIGLLVAAFNRAKKAIR